MKDSLWSLVDRKGRVTYERFIDYLKNCDEHTFVTEAVHPMLRGKELYDGMLQEAGGGINTMPFKASSLRASLAPQNEIVQQGDPKFNRKESDSLSRAVYLLAKGRDSFSKPNEYTLGRDGDNDLVIPDYSISKCHASIVIGSDAYYVVDHGSTNETYVNDEQVQPHTSAVLPVSADVSFGRMVFRFAPPEQVYDLLHLHQSSPFDN